MSDQIKQSIMRIRDNNNSVIGGGFRVGKTMGITCAHVIKNALQLNSESSLLPEQEVLIDFPFVSPSAIDASVLSWMPSESRYNDIAILNWDGGLTNFPRIQILSVDDYWNYPFRICGFPEGYDETGVWVGGLLKDETIDGRVQLQGINEFGYFIERGFSGSPVWDDERNGIIGMVVSVDTDTSIRTAYMIPSVDLLKVLKKISSFSENYQLTSEEKSESQSNSFAASTKTASPVKATIGIAVDVSGSMRSSIRNDSGGQLTRLQSFNDSVSKLTEKAKKISGKGDEIEADISIFAYGFGLQNIGVYDLLSLIEANNQEIISNDEIERLKEKYTREMRQKYSGYSGLGDLARSYGLGNLVNQVEREMRGDAERKIRQQIFSEIISRIDRQIGETTMSLNEIAESWKQGSNQLSNFEDLIYGATPMTEAFRKLDKRFEAETSKRSDDADKILFLLSDGEPTDGDPLPVSNKLKTRGVNIVTCFITNNDIANPRVLYKQPNSEWVRGAKLMFDIASEIDLDTPFTQFLLQKGWAIESGSKLFVQINHSEVLEEFIEVVLSPLEIQAGEIGNRGFL